jgi:D-proline reductase (dithiol) PrdB
MCNQTVSLLAAAIESRGIPTVCLVLLREVAENVRPPRALFVPYAHGFPLGMPNDATTQRRVLMEALALFDEPRGPALRELSRP